MTLRLIHSNRAPRTVERVAEARLPTEIGEFRIIGFRSLISTEEFVALVKGDLRADQAGLEVVERVRLEVEPHDFFAGYLKTKKEKMGHLVSVA